MNNHFINYVGGAFIHDAKIQKVEHGDNTVVVTLLTSSYGTKVLHFTGVTHVKSLDPVGMRLYSVSEMKNDSGIRHFVFVSADDGENDVPGSSLEVFAAEFTES